MKHRYTAISLPYLSKQEKITAKFAVQVCGSKKVFVVAEAQKIIANVPQTCGLSVADHPLLFFGICGCGIESKFAVPSTAYKLLRFQKFRLRVSGSTFVFVCQFWQIRIDLLITNKR